MGQMIHSKSLRIAIECRIPDARQGIGTAILFLAHVLSRVNTRDQEYIFVVNEELRDWLAPHLSGSCHIAVLASPQPPKLERILRSVKPLLKLLKKMPRPLPEIPISDGYIEREKFDVVHFPTQQAYLTSVPSIYQPWDLQHVHYPSFFSERDLAIRDLYYRAFCAQARMVCVQAEWTRQDVIQSYGVSANKVAVIPWGSTFEAYSAPSVKTLDATRKRYALPKDFFFYPAVTWPHKNHAVLLRALSVLKKRDGRVVHVYLTGSVTEYNTSLEAMAEALEVSEQVHRLGFVTTDELQSIYASATAMVFPSLFEGFGLPLLEAFHAGLPVLSSNATVLPEIAQDAALYFDPNSEVELADQMICLLQSPELRQQLREKGKLVLSQFDSSKTAEALCHLYSSVAARE